MRSLNSPDALLGYAIQTKDGQFQSLIQFDGEMLELEQATQIRLLEEVRNNIQEILRQRLEASRQPGSDLDVDNCQWEADDYENQGYTVFHDLRLMERYDHFLDAFSQCAEVLVPGRSIEERWSWLADQGMDPHDSGSAYQKSFRLSEEGPQKVCLWCYKDEETQHWKGLIVPEDLMMLWPIQNKQKNLIELLQDYAKHQGKSITFEMWISFQLDFVSSDKSVESSPGSRKAWPMLSEETTGHLDYASDILWVTSLAPQGDMVSYQSLLTAAALRERACSDEKKMLERWDETNTAPTDKPKMRF